MAHHDPIGLIAPNAGLAQLNERSRDIFRQIVESYLATGEPVGSRNISRLIAVPLSPASVRNVMADLEQLGLIYAPHTSAGRLPFKAIIHVADSTFSNNSAGNTTVTGSAGAIFDAGAVAITGSSFLNNTSTAAGGASDYEA